VACGDILFARTGATVGKSYLVDDIPYPATFASYLIRVRCDRRIIHPEFAAWFFQSPHYWSQIVDGATGTGQPNFNGSKLAELSIPVPPLNEQRRIVDKLNLLATRFVRARAELERARRLAKVLRLRALQAAFHWQIADENLPKGWSRKRVDEIGAVQLGRQRSPKDHSGPHMRSYLRAANITWSGLDLSDIKEMNFSPAEFEVFQLKPGDVLLNEGSGSASEVGKPAIWNGEIEDACFQNTLLRVRPHKYHPRLLRFCFLYIALSGEFIQNTQGVNIIHIGKAGLSKKLIPVPPLSEQEALLAKIEMSFARANRLEAEAVRASALLDRLEASVLAKAFRGELVPQDAIDEPAAALLDRIRKQSASGAIAKGKRRRRSANA
jgi:type I restriction enzyme S subunit